MAQVLASLCESHPDIYLSMLLDGMVNQNQACDKDVALFTLAEIAKIGKVIFDEEKVALITKHVSDDPNKVPGFLLEAGRYDVLQALKQQTTCPVGAHFQTRAVSEMSESEGAISVEDVCLVKDLTSEQGLALNGHFGKVIAKQSCGRWAIRMKDRTCALKGANLYTCLRAAHMRYLSDGGEHLLALKPSRKEIQMCASLGATFCQPSSRTDLV